MKTILSHLISEPPYFILICCNFLATTNLKNTFFAIKLIIIKQSFITFFALYLYTVLWLKIRVLV